MKKSVFDAKKNFGPQPLAGASPWDFANFRFRGPFGAKNRKIGISRGGHDVIMQTDHFLNAETLLRTIEVG